MTEAQRARATSPKLLAAFAAGAAASVFLGVYGRTHDPTGDTVTELFFKNQITMKAWLATAAVLFVFVQVFSALRLYGKIGSGPAPAWLGDVHRLSGTLAFVLTLPVAYHCLWSIGFNADAGFDRVFIHSLAGCLFYGAFVAKVLVVRSKGLPGWALPLAGSLVFTGLVGAWLTSAFWFFDTRGLGW